jgi:Spy/CpxP family protein refolding chaperone
MNRIMKKQILSLAVALLLGSAVCMAQDNRGERPDMSKRIEQMVTDLGLNETQAKEFKAAMEEMRPDRNNSGERPSREEMEKKRNEVDAKIKKILTDEQYKKYQSMRSERRQRRER